MAAETLNIQPQKGNKQVQSTWPTGHCNATPAKGKREISGGESTQRGRNESKSSSRRKRQDGEESAGLKTVIGHAK